jgi:hypothetical protein
VDEPPGDGVGEASLAEDAAADGNAVEAGVAVSGDAAVAGVGSALGEDVGTKTVGIGEALKGGAEGSLDGAALGVEVCSNAVPAP